MKKSLAVLLALIITTVSFSAKAAPAPAEAPDAAAIKDFSLEGFSPFEYEEGAVAALWPQSQPDEADGQYKGGYLFYQGTAIYEYGRCVVLKNPLSPLPSDLEIRDSITVDDITTNAYYDVPFVSYKRDSDGNSLEAWLTLKGKDEGDGEDIERKYIDKGGLSCASFVSRFYKNTYDIVVSDLLYVDFEYPAKEGEIPRKSDGIPLATKDGANIALTKINTGPVAGDIARRRYVQS